MIKNSIYLTLVVALCLNVWAADMQKPNVIVLMTDDQGYGDLSAHGNPLLKTPQLDKLREESVRFTDFHVTPKCTPTRGQLMTGIDAMRNGATRICQGRSMVRPELKMMPQYFADAGYATGMFGKWHLGDSYPYLPTFRGFQEVLSFRAWGITSLADHWGNTYFDPVLMHNGQDKKYEGYITDIFFAEAMKWMDRCQSQEKPFFVYIPTNTPHVPEQVARHYSAAYEGKHEGKKVPANFYGMIANIDENVGKLEQYLTDKGLRDNTLLIFLSDNGTQNGNAMRIWNAGMRDQKGSVFEGGHRVPLFIRWSEGKLKHGTEISELTTVQDILPTLMDLCGLKGDRSELTGTSLAGLLKGTQEKLPQRMVVNQYGLSCQKWDQAVVMNGKWRLIGGNKLYHIADDPHQDNNVYDKFPEIAGAMNTYYDQWYAQARPLFEKERYITIGSDIQNPLTLYANDWQGGHCDNRRDLVAGSATGYWDLIVDKEGTYEIELRRWSEESGKALTDSFDDQSKKGAIPVAKARLQVGDFDQTLQTQPNDTVARFTAHLKKGTTKLTAEFLDEQGNVICGAMYVKVTGQITAKTDHASQTEPEKSEKPNFVIIFIDDLGYGDIGPFGSTINDTPHLDRLAAEGVKLTSFYVPAPVCTPSRAGLMTGCYPKRVGLAYGTWKGVLCPKDPKGLNPKEITLAEMLKEAGYITGCFGKWHLGDQPEFLPNNQGFDYYFGIPYSHDMWPQNPKAQKYKNGVCPLPVLRNNEVVDIVESMKDQGQLCKRFTDEAVHFIEANKDKPFFVYLPHAFVHHPRSASEEFLIQAGIKDPAKLDEKQLTIKWNYYMRERAKAQIEEVDGSVGQIIDTLRRLKLEKNTCVIFTSDNGGTGGCVNDPLRGKKGTTWEGGMREPTIAWWPGTIPAGSTCDEIATSMDLLPTFAKIAGGKTPSDRKIDGNDISSLLRDPKNAKTPYEAFFYYKENTLQAVRSGAWKLHTNGQLYNLETDIGEIIDVAARHPEVVSKLERYLEQCRADLDNPNNCRPAGICENAKLLVSPSPPDH